MRLIYLRMIRLSEIRLVIAAILAAALSLSQVLAVDPSFAAGPVGAKTTTVEHANIMLEVMGMMKETIAIISRITHSPNDADKASLTAMMDRLGDVERGLEGGQGQSMILRDITVMLRQSMAMIRKVIHAYPVPDRDTLISMKTRLAGEIAERLAAQMKGGEAAAALEASLRDMAGMMGEISGFMLDTKHTYTSKYRAQMKKLAGMSERMDGIIATHEERPLQ